MPKTSISLGIFLSLFSRNILHKVNNVNILIALNYRCKLIKSLKCDKTNLEPGGKFGIDKT